MKSYDNTIKYYELLMYYKDTAIYKKYSLPDGFHFEFYKDGNMNDWINIHIESGEFCAIEEGIMIFHDFYDTFIQELNKRCIFKFIFLSQSIFTAIPLTRASIASIVRFSQPVFSNILCM